MRRAAIALAMVVLVLALPASGVDAEPGTIDTIAAVFARLKQCWRPPAGNFDLTVLMSFRRDGSLLGRPRITHDGGPVQDSERLAARIAVMEMLQRCTPLPFTEALGGAIAGRPLTLRLLRKPKPQPTERHAWLTPKTP